MTTTKIKELIEIRNNEIEYQIKDIKDVYGIDVTNEILENIVIFSLNAIEYYNKKYNAYTGNEYEQLYYFGDDFYNISNYKYNLLNSTNYTNKKYVEFIKSIDNKQLLNTISFIFNIIQIQIETLESKNINIEYKTNEINYNLLSIKDELELNLPTDEMILFLIYYYKNNKCKNITEVIKNDIKLNLNSLNSGICPLLEDIYFNYISNYELTNMKSEYYLELLEENNETYNKELHKRLLEDIKDIDI